MRGTNDLQRSGGRVSVSPAQLAWPAVFALGALAGFLAGHQTHRASSKFNVGNQGPANVDEVYGRRPSDESDKLWDALFPRQGGFFKHPELAPTRSAFAVFHQLHCLNGIRQGYWALYDAASRATPDAPFDETELPMMSSPPHIRHCIDLLRQSLMCAPDLTVEVKNESMGGVTGFGTEHVCTDWSALLAFAAEWETFEQDRPEPGKAEHVHHR